MPIKGSKKMTHEQWQKLNLRLRVKDAMTQPRLPRDRRWKYPDGISDDTVGLEIGVSASAVSKERLKLYPEGIIAQMPPRPKKKGQFIVPNAGEPFAGMDPRATDPTVGMVPAPDTDTYETLLERLRGDPALLSAVNNMVHTIVEEMLGAK